MARLCKYIVIATNLIHLSVCESGRSREGHSTELIKFSFFSSLDLDVTRGSPLTQLAMALAATINIKYII